MKKINKILTAIIAAASLTSAAGTGAYAAPQPPAGGTSEIIPMYTVIAGASVDLTHEGWGYMTCRSQTKVQSGYIAGVIAELQRNEGSYWNTIETVSGTGWGDVGVTDSWYVASGYEYRVKSSHYAYDANWNVIESDTKYSDSVWY